MKIIDKINKNNESGQPYFSFEFFPPKTEAGVQNLYQRMDRMASLNPLFCDITWGAGGSTSELTLEIASKAQKYCGLEMLMHLVNIIFLYFLILIHLNIYFSEDLYKYAKE